jgi:dipeptidyl aminopeptidase/acylaminoacyl peptidase
LSRNWSRCSFLFALFVFVSVSSLSAQQTFTIEQILSAPGTSDLMASKTGHRLAWVEVENGRWNIWGAEGPSFAGRQITAYKEDDGGEIALLQLLPGATGVVYVRNEGKNSAGEYPNPTHNPAGTEQDVWLVPWDGGAPRKIDAGSSPQVSSLGRIAYEKNGQVWLASAKEEDKPVQLVERGHNIPVGWSPDGKKLLFVSLRGDHSFIGLYDGDEKTVKFLAPSVDSDGDAVWSLDGKHIAFVRQPAVPRDTPNGYFIEPDRPKPWAIWVTDADGRNAHEIWRSTETLQGSYPYMAQDTGGGTLNWGTGDTLVMASEEDGWQHLYALSSSGGAPKLLTPGRCEVEQWSVSSDGTGLTYNSNCDDVERRHLWKVHLPDGAAQQLTKGDSIEWNAVFTGDANTIAYIGSDARRFGVPFVKAASLDAKATAIRNVADFKDFPVSAQVTPQEVTFSAPDGLEIHGQLFLPSSLKAGEKRPALLFIHGGPPRQMLLGWHYMRYYANCYAMNQYLANRGYLVLSVNYRSGIGYGRAFRMAPGRAGRGATEYQDILAAGKYLQGRTDVDPRRVGLWGGSYGGLMTAMGLARNSDVFAAGVDIHGVHDWPSDNWEGKHIPPDMVKLAHESSPVASVDTWKSPVLFIHGDDDRNVMFSQTVDLVARLRPRGVHVEQLIFPDEIHDFLLYSTWLTYFHANSEFFDRQFAWPPK